MPKINLLDPSVFNQIAAGEVVERPASIIKELVENSIDAGATRIEVQIFDGGITKLIVSDNGSGIAPDDLELAFMPHATSKIKDYNDLFSLDTLGFRGEALASIASVTEIEVITKTASTEGQSIKLSGGKVVAKGEKGSPQGTYFCVENLFFNTPARQKFLKKPKKEESEITTLITRLILANPNVAFKYSADNKLIFNSTGKGIEDAIFAIYGAQTMQNLVKVDYTDGDYNLIGYIGKTTYFKPNRTYQTIMINNRWVADSIASVAVSQSYESYMMKHCFPFCVLYLTMPNEEVDVNVHPNKLEVRFQDSRKIFGFVYKAISEALFNDITKKTQQEIHPNEPQIELVKPVEVEVTQTTPNDIVIEQKQEINLENTSQSSAPVENKENEKQSEAGASLEFFFNNPYSTTKTNEIHSSEGSVLNEIVIDKLIDSTIQKYEFQDTPKSQKIEPKPIQTQLVADEIQDKHAFLSTQVIGKLFNTFVVVEIDDNVYFIDQHAAHERLLYDKYVRQVKQKEMACQPLLLPYTIQVNHAEEQFILDNMELLQQLGFDISPFGTLSFRVSAIPCILPNLNVSNFFANFLSNINSIVNLKSIDLILDILAETACKHAVKGGDDLAKEEIVKLVSDFADGNTTLQCPHGRPFVVKFTRKDLDKWFKRTV
ncbi:MAG: DNA mismatch repair endonuclease MutL [Clostridia bacterium]|nr:DNA mismatch repair endonuclease MutL [Clostridia bacterium]